MPAATGQKWRPPKPKQAAASTATKAPATTNASQAQVAPTANASKQLTDQDIVTQQQSLTIVKTLLGATFGCVTYLRGLLSEDSFEDVIIGGPPAPPSAGSTQAPDNASDGTENYLAPVDTSADGHGPPPSSQQPAGAGGSQGQPKGLRIKQIKANHSPEADKILKWINESVMDAVEKQYLKACVFGIYLDAEDPSNMVETVTVSFNYPPITAGSSTRLPELTIAKTFGDLNLSGAKDVPAGAVTEAGTLIYGGGNMDVDGPASSSLKTVGEVKKAIRKLIRNLIISCQNLAELPSRRWVSMKLIYMDNVPDDYEPPHFIPVQPESKEWHFSTQTPYQMPEIDTTGCLATKHHAFDLKITSIVDQLPAPVASAWEDSNKFGMPFPPTASELRKRKMENVAVQREDAAKRRFVWNALEAAKARAQIDPEYADADGEDDDATLGTSKAKTRPVGVKDESGDIGPYQAPEFPPSPQLDRTAAGHGRLKSLVFGKRDERDSFGSQPDGLLSAVAKKLIHPATQASIVQTQAIIDDNAMDVDPVEASEPSRNDAVNNQESIQSFTQTQKQNVLQASSFQTPADEQEPAQAEPAQSSPSQAAAAQAIFTSCPCGDESEDSKMINCAACKLDFHISCDGWPEKSAYRKPKKYTCILCRMLVRSGSPEDAKDLAMLLETVWPTIALIRRAMWIAKELVTFEAKDLRSRLGCRAGDFKSVLDRLTADDFVVEKVAEGTKKGAKTFVWNASKDQQTKYAAHFSPNTMLEQEICGWSLETAKKLTGRNGAVKYDRVAKGRRHERQNQPTDQTRIEPADAATSTTKQSATPQQDTTEPSTTAVPSAAQAAVATRIAVGGPQPPMTPAASQHGRATLRPDRMSQIRTPLDLSSR